MPTYDIRTKDGEEKEVLCSISTMEENVKSGEWVVLHKTASSLVSQTGSTLGKTSGDWKDLMKKMKKGSGRGNTINT
jgi:hypothetical protein